MIKAFLLDSPRLSLRATTVVGRWLMHLIEVRTVRVTGPFRVLSRILPCRLLPRCLIQRSHLALLMVKCNNFSRFQQYNDHYRREETTSQACSRHLLRHRSSRTHWRHYKEEGTWRDVRREDIQLIKYQNIWELLQTACLCCLQLRMGPYQTGVEMSGSR